MTKVVIVDEGERVLSRVESHTGAEHRRLANRVMAEALKQAGLPFREISYVVATGYGRINVPFADRQITELTCHARGVSFLFPSARTVLDIGGQDAKGLRLNDGKLLDFVMNDRCAAGTGRFLEILSGTLGLKLDDLSRVSRQARNKTSISSTCTIFAQQEIISCLSAGVAVADIVAGLHDSIAGRAVTMLRRLKIEPEVVFTGGVARNSGVVEALRKSLGLEVLVPEDPLISGALGAALMGKDVLLGAQAAGEDLPRAARRLSAASFYT